MLILSPTIAAPVCHVGDPLQITCMAPMHFIGWRIFPLNEQGFEEVTIYVQINSLDDNQIQQREVNSSTLTFTRISAQRVLPLISTLSIDLVNIGLNGTVVWCLDVVNPTTSALTTIKIIDTMKISELGHYIKLPLLYFITEVNNNRHPGPIHYNIDYYGGIFS